MTSRVRAAVHGQALVWFLALALMLCAGASSNALAQELIGRASVIDGDTIDVARTRVRLWGIDAPESKQTCVRDGKPWLCGNAAFNALSEWLGERVVHCEPRTMDRYQRVVALCRVAGDDVSAWLVANGHALAFRRYSNDYVLAEDEARRERVGIWSSEFKAPWEWRADQRQK